MQHNEIYEFKFYCERTTKIMKIGRNDLCPCGSGKKYKKCCYPQTFEAENNIKGNDIDDYEVQDEYVDEDVDNLLNSLENFNDQEFLLQVFNSFRTITLDLKSHIKEYYKIRKMHSDIVNTMIRYHEAGKFEQKIDSNYVYKNEHLPESKETLYFIESSFNLETREGVQALYDLLVYKISPNINCITEDFIQSHRYRKPEKVEFLQSMLDSTIGLFEITKTDIDEGYVYLKDIFTGIEYKIVDIALSGSRTHDNFYMYTRLITYHGICFNTGLSLTFDKKDSFIKAHIKTHKKDYIPEGELLRFIELYNHFSKNPNKMNILTNTIK